MPDVRIFVKNAENVAIEGALVKAKAIGSGNEPVFSNGGSTIVKEIAERSAATTGLVTLSLPANSTLLPANSYYRITIRVDGESRERKFNIQVPAVAGPLDVEDVLHAPGEVDESALAAHRASVGTHDDVDLTSNAVGKVLMWDGTNFSPASTHATDLEVASAVAVEAAARAAADTAHEADTTNIHGIADTAQLETVTGSAAKVETHRTDTSDVHGIPDTSVLATDSEVATAVSDHSTDTTNVHGIADTSALETTAGSAAKVAAHEADTSVHGIADTTVLATDAEVAAAVATEATARADVDTALDGRLDTAEEALDDVTAISARDANHLWEALNVAINGATLTTGFEDLGIADAIAAQPESGRAILSLTFFDGLIFPGYGDWAANTGPIDLVSLDPTSLVYTEEATLETEATLTWRELGGELFALATDPRGATTQVFARRDAAGVWTLQTIDIAVPAHIFDIALYGGDLYLAGSSAAGLATIWRSTDGDVGATWEVFDQNATAGLEFRFLIEIDGKLYWEDSYAGGSFTDASRTWDGSVFGVGASFLSPTTDVPPGPGRKPTALSATRAVYLSESQSPGVFSEHFGTSRRTLHRGIRDFDDDGVRLYLLDAAGQVRMQAIADTDAWATLYQGPPNATAMCVTAALDVYIGTDDGHIWRKI